MAGELKKYPVQVNGHDTVLRLNETDAAAMGLVQPEKPAAKKARQPANKARTAANK